MRRRDARHYSEEELLLHLLAEDSPGLSAEIAVHTTECGECAAVLGEYREVVAGIQEWKAPAIDEREWERVRSELSELFKQGRARGRRGVAWHNLRRGIEFAWNYALENPVPTVVYITAATLFALERTITTFRLEKVVPATGAILEILRQML
jgi:hypothetical protein